MDPHCFWDNGAIFHGYSAFSMTYRQFEKTVKNRVSLGCFLSHMFLAHRHNVPQKIHVSLALLLLASLKLFRKWCGPWNVQLLISHASQSTLDKTNGTKKKERTKSKNRKMKEMLSSLNSLHHLLYSWENVVTNIDLWVATKLDSLLLRASSSASPTMCISKSVHLHKQSPTLVILYSLLDECPKIPKNSAPSHSCLEILTRLCATSTTHPNHPSFIASSP